MSMIETILLKLCEGKQFVHLGESDIFLNSFLHRCKHPYEAEMQFAINNIDKLKLSFKVINKYLTLLETFCQKLLATTAQCLFALTSML